MCGRSPACDEAMRCDADPDPDPDTGQEVSRSKKGRNNVSQTCTTTLCIARVSGT